MPNPSPRHVGSRSPRRILAVGGAAAITVVTIGGGLGIGPVAALATTTTARSSPSSTPSSDRSATSTAPDTEGTSSSIDGTSTGGGSWLSIDRPSADDNQGGSQNTTPPGQGGGGDDPTAPAIPASSGHGKRIVFDESDQRVWLVDGQGRLARTYLVSGSLHDNLSPGSYDVYSKSMHTVSFDGRETMRYMVRFTQGENAPIGFHDIPRRPDGTMVETRDQLGTPQSAGCVRQWEPDAKALWRFAPVGTKVVVVA